MRSRYGCLSSLLISAALLFPGCSENGTVPEDGGKSETLRNYLVASDMDLPDLLAGWIIRADAVHGHESDYHIIDIRDESDFEQGHVPSSVRSSLAGILAAAAGSGGKPIVVVCYTGQTAGHAVMALRLSGHSGAMALEFGMSAWNSDFDDWSSSCADFAIGNANWISPPGSISTDTAGDYPSLSASASDGEGILAERVAAMLSGGFKGINAYNVLAAPTGFSINCFWPPDGVTTYGNIIGSHRIFPMSLENGEISRLDPEAVVVTYCWTGHTSSMITAYLTLLGYDAASLKFGANGMIFSILTSNRWEGSFDYGYETVAP